METLSTLTVLSIGNALGNVSLLEVHRVGVGLYIVRTFRRSLELYCNMETFSILTVLSIWTTLWISLKCAHWVGPKCSRTSPQVVRVVLYCRNALYRRCPGFVMYFPGEVTSSRWRLFVFCQIYNATQEMRSPCCGRVRLSNDNRLVCHKCKHPVAARTACVRSTSYCILREMYRVL